MNNTELIKVLKHLIKTQPKDLRMQRYAVAKILENKPTCKQLQLVLDIIGKADWEIHIVDGDRKKAYNECLYVRYRGLIRDMMLDIAQGKDGEALAEFKINNNLY